MEYIYSRVSTGKQETENQLNRLQGLYPRATIIEEIASGAKKRPKLEALLADLKPNDVLIVAALDRLGRRTSEILTLIEALTAKGVILKSLREGLDYSTPFGRMATQILVACSELERNLISIRTKEALDAKRKQGIIGGRRAMYPPELVAKAKSLRASGMTYKQISEETGLSKSRVWQLC